MNNDIRRIENRRKYLAEAVDELKINQIQRHIFLCCDQKKPKCSLQDKSLESWDFLKKPAEGTGTDKRGWGLSNQGKLSADLYPRTDCSGLPGRGLVPLVHTGGAGKNYSGTLDRWQAGG